VGLQASSLVVLTHQRRLRRAHRGGKYKLQVGGWRGWQGGVGKLK
jgi:hypothetical protein